MVSNTQYFWFKYAMYLAISLKNLRFAAPVWRIFSSTKNTGPGMTWLKTDQKLWGVLNLGFWKFLTKNYGILPSRALKKTASRHPRIPKGTPPRCHHRPMIFNITVPGGALGSHTVSAPRPFQQRGHSCAVEVFRIRLSSRRKWFLAWKRSITFHPTFGDFIFKTMVKKMNQ